MQSASASGTDAPQWPTWLDQSPLPFASPSNFKRQIRPQTLFGVPKKTSVEALIERARRSVESVKKEERLLNPSHRAESVIGQGLLHDLDATLGQALPAPASNSVAAYPRHTTDRVNNINNKQSFSSSTDRDPLSPTFVESSPLKRPRAVANTPNRPRHPPTNRNPLSPIPASPPSQPNTDRRNKDRKPRQFERQGILNLPLPIRISVDLDSAAAACALSTTATTPHRVTRKTSAESLINLAPAPLTSRRSKFELQLQDLISAEACKNSVESDLGGVNRPGLPLARLRRHVHHLAPIEVDTMSTSSTYSAGYGSIEPPNPRSRLPMPPFGQMSSQQQAREQARSPAKNKFGFRFPPTPTQEAPPTPPLKDSPSLSRTTSFAATSDTDGRASPTESFFNRVWASRTGSIYTLGRASFTNQISQLTSIRLPQAASLSTNISTIATSTGAARALNDAADQIRVWIQKSNDVLEGLDSEDDVEWAAAGGREAVGEVDAAIGRFEALVDVYVGAVEQLEQREDITQVSAQDLHNMVQRMERITSEWSSTKDVLQGVKEQVETAMEWEELWNSVLGDISQELDSLSRLVFEMEERRHKISLLDPLDPTSKQLDFSELETIVEEAPSKRQPSTPTNNRISLVPSMGEPQSPAHQQQQSEDASNLMSLFARMQPLRASLDFLPMKLASFLDRAETVFPSACEDLRSRQEDLEAKYKKLGSDAESLRKELGEDRWVIMFRKAGSKTLKMCESVERSIVKLRDELDDGSQFTNPAAVVDKINLYEKKKEHYSPAIQRVIAIVDKGVQSRSTVNGEILRLLEDLQRRWTQLEAQMKGMDFALEQLNIRQQTSQSLRDSTSTVFSAGSSTGGTTIVDTPGSSPASSIIYVSRQGTEQPPTPHGAHTKSRQSSFAGMNGLHRKSANRLSILPTSGMANNQQQRPSAFGRSTAFDLRSPTIPSDATARLYSTPTPARSISRLGSNPDEPKSNKPRWCASTKMHDTVIGHNFRPMSLDEPSPYRKEAIPPPSVSRMPRAIPRAVSTPGPSSDSILSPSQPNFSRSVMNSSSQATAGASSLPFRPGSSLARPIQRPSTPSTQRLRPQASTSALPASKLGNTTSKLPGPKTASNPQPSTLQKIKSSLPRASMYFSPAGAQRSANLGYNVSPPSEPSEDHDRLSSDESPTISRTGPKPSALPRTPGLPRPSALPRPGSLLPQPSPAPSKANGTHGLRAASRAGARLSLGLSSLHHGRKSSVGFRNDEGDERKSIKPTWR